MTHPTQEPEPRLPFGRYADRPLAEVPDYYLLWATGVLTVSSDLRTAVVAELARRGVEAPAPPTLRRPQCPICGPRAPLAVRHVEGSLGREHLRAWCAQCAANLGCVPRVEPFLSLAAGQGQP
jgi:hypothetical protein